MGNILRADVDPGLGEELLTCGLPLDLGTWVCQSQPRVRLFGEEWEVESYCISLEARLRLSGRGDGFTDMMLASCPALAAPYPKPLISILRRLGRSMGRPEDVLGVCGLEEAAFAVRDGCWTECGHMVTRSLRPAWPQDNLGSGRETDRNKMSDFRGVGSRREVTRGALLTRSHPWVCSELLSMRWREVGVDTAEGE